MSIQSYEMIEEQASGAIGGAPGASAAVGGEEIHTLLVSSPPSSKRKSWVVAAAALMMAGAFVGAVAFAPHFSGQPAGEDLCLGPASIGAQKTQGSTCMHLIIDSTLVASFTYSSTATSIHFMNKIFFYMVDSETYWFSGIE